MGDKVGTSPLIADSPALRGGGRERGSVALLDGPADAKLPAIERRKVYDTTQPGRGNGGHTFGDKLTDDERKAVIEYLKTL